MIRLVEAPTGNEDLTLLESCARFREEAGRKIDYRIGQFETDGEAVERLACSGASHLVKLMGDRIWGYSRLRRIDTASEDGSIGARIFSLASETGRLPACEMQLVSQGAEVAPGVTPRSLLKELILAAFRYCNERQVRFLFSACDRRGLEMLRGLGMRCASMGAPFDCAGRMLVVACIPVTNSNYSSLNHSRDSQKADSSYASTSQESDAKGTGIFHRFDVLSELMGD